MGIYSYFTPLIRDLSNVEKCLINEGSSMQKVITGNNPKVISQRSHGNLQMDFLPFDIIVKWNHSYFVLGSLSGGLIAQVIQIKVSGVLLIKGIIQY